MRQFVLITAAVFLIGVTVLSCNKEQENLLHLVVLFKFNDAATKDQVKQAEEAFEALPSKINSIKDFEWCSNNSPEGITQGFTHCSFLSFASEKERDVYLPHPGHKAFGEVLPPGALAQ